MDYAPLCEILTELIPAYSVGATNPEESRLVETLLPFCPAAADSLAQYREMTDSLLHLIPATHAPPPVSALMERVRTYEEKTQSQPDAELERMVHLPTHSETVSSPEFTPHILPSVAEQPRPQRGGNRLLMGLVAASILILAGVSSYWMNEIISLQRNQSNLIALLVSNQQQAEPPPTTIKISGANHYRQLMPAETISEGASARFVWNEDQQVGAVFASDLPQIPENHVYQIWVVTLEGDSLSLGTFSIDENGEGALVFKAEQRIENYTHIGITVEPGDGSSEPTTPHLVVGVI